LTLRRQKYSMKMISIEPSRRRNKSAKKWRSSTARDPFWISSAPRP
jgi:hypothetical protein